MLDHKSAVNKIKLSIGNKKKHKNIDTLFC